MRIKDHPILGKADEGRKVDIIYDGRRLEARRGEPIAAALMANGIKALHYTRRAGEPRGVFCAQGRCTDCIMIVNGVMNVRTCVTPVEEGMVVQTQSGIKGAEER